MSEHEVSDLVGSRERDAMLAVAEKAMDWAGVTATERKAVIDKLKPALLTVYPAREFFDHVRRHEGYLHVTECLEGPCRQVYITELGHTCAISEEARARQKLDRVLAAIQDMADLFHETRRIG